ncbi:hypothetical protein [Bradyrhizobium sp. RDT46]|uniref:hypothetical protein n=1 Tax=Bradyrhizobium sp. RDT46 TaxID=3341829 RepID=UPI0035C70341
MPKLATSEIVILDNLGGHKGKAAHQPPCRAPAESSCRYYGPDLNPIEQVLAKFKRLMRAAKPRNVQAHWRKFGELLDFLAEEECINYFKNSGNVLYKDIML